jgi:hypothetical protein
MIVALIGIFSTNKLTPFDWLFKGMMTFFRNLIIRTSVIRDRMLNRVGSCKTNPWIEKLLDSISGFKQASANNAKGIFNIEWIRK